MRLVYVEAIFSTYLTDTLQVNQRILERHWGSAALAFLLEAGKPVDTGTRPASSNTLRTDNDPFPYVFSTLKIPIGDPPPFPQTSYCQAAPPPQSHHCL